MEETTTTTTTVNNNINNPLDPLAGSRVRFCSHDIGVPRTPTPTSSAMESTVTWVDFEAGTPMAEITQAELNNMHRIFQSFDKDNSGTINVMELRLVMGALGIELNDHETRLILTDLDDNHTGELEFEEFLQLMLRNRELCMTARQRGDTAQHVAAVLETHRFLNDSNWKRVWDTSFLLTVGYYAITVPLRFWCLVEELDSASNTILECTLSVFLLLNVIVNFNIAYGDGSRLVVELWPCALHYAKGWFAIDFLGAVPFDLIARGLGASKATSAAAACFRVLPLIRVGTLFKPSQLEGTLSSAYIQFHYHLAPVMLLVFWFVVLVNSAAVAHSRVSRNNPEGYDYSDSIYWVMYTISTVGYGDIVISSLGEKVLACCLFLASLLLNGMVVAKLSGVFQNKSLEDERRKKMRDTLAVLKFFNIPLPLRNEILSFQQHILQNSVVKAYSEVLEGLPASMQDQLGLYMRIKFISSVPLFETASTECRMALATKLTNLVVPPDEFIVVAGEIGREMYFLGHGFADVLAPDGTFITTLRKGHFFGEIALLGQDTPRTASVKALTFCDLFALHKADFQGIMKRFPRFRQDMEADASRKVAFAREQREHSAPRLVRIIGSHGNVLISHRIESCPNIPSLVVDDTSPGGERSGDPTSEPPMVKVLGATIDADASKDILLGLEGSSSEEETESASDATSSGPQTGSLGSDGRDGGGDPPAPSPLPRPSAGTTTPPHTTDTHLVSAESQESLDADSNDSDRDNNNPRSTMLPPPLVDSLDGFGRVPERHRRRPPSVRHSAEGLNPFQDSDGIKTVQSFFTGPAPNGHRTTSWMRAGSGQPTQQPLQELMWRQETIEDELWAMKGDVSYIRSAISDYDTLFERLGERIEAVATAVGAPPASQPSPMGRTQSMHTPPTVREGRGSMRPRPASAGQLTQQSSIRATSFVAGHPGTPPAPAGRTSAAQKYTDSMSAWSPFSLNIHRMPETASVRIPILRPKHGPRNAHTRRFVNVLRVMSDTRQKPRAMGASPPAHSDPNLPLASARHTGLSAPPMRSATSSPSVAEEEYPALPGAPVPSRPVIPTKEPKDVTH